MTDENKLIRDTGRALRARQLLENELLTEAFKTLEDAYIAAWRSTNVEDQLGREKLFLAINVVGKVKQHLATAIHDGRLAEVELVELAKKRERAAARKQRGAV